MLNAFAFDTCLRMQLSLPCLRCYMELTIALSIVAIRSTLVTINPDQ
jgi:hypothetical protein